MEKLECILHHRCSGCQEEVTAVEAGGLTNGTEHQPVCQRPAVRQAAPVHINHRFNIDGSGLGY